MALFLNAGFANKRRKHHFRQQSDLNHPGILLTRSHPKVHRSDTNSLVGQFTLAVTLADPQPQQPCVGRRLLLRRRIVTSHELRSRNKQHNDYAASRDEVRYSRHKGYTMTTWPSKMITLPLLQGIFWINGPIAGAHSVSQIDWSACLNLISSVFFQCKHLYCASKILYI